jgi:succinate dehydrogenase/fumarate reductase cytochrome b subunit
MLIGILLIWAAFAVHPAIGIIALIIGLGNMTANRQAYNEKQAAELRRLQSLENLRARGVDI